MIAAFNSHVGMFVMVDSCCSFICYENIGVTLKILLLHLKSDSATLKSGEGLAALNNPSLIIFLSVLNDNKSDYNSDLIVCVCVCVTK